MTIDERIEAITHTLELAARDIEDMRSLQRDFSQALSGILNVVSGLVDLSKSHESRLNRLEGK